MIGPCHAESQLGKRVEADAQRQQNRRLRKLSLQERARGIQKEIRILEKQKQSDIQKERKEKGSFSGAPFFPHSARTICQRECCRGRGKKQQGRRNSREGIENKTGSQKKSVGCPPAMFSRKKKSCRSCRQKQIDKDQRVEIHRHIRPFR